MSVEKVKEYLKQWNKDKDVIELADSTATVLLAAQALNVEPGRIAKSITIKNGESGLMVVASGDTKIDNKKFKSFFKFNPRMLSPEDAFNLTGFAVGGVCPFGLNDNVPIYLDDSLKRYDTVFPACGSSNSMIEISPAELEEVARVRAWIDVCKFID